MQDYKQELIDQFESENIHIEPENGDKTPPKFCCEGKHHQKEPIREGDSAIILCVREDGEWKIHSLFCTNCQVLDKYSDIVENRPVAVIEGIIQPGIEETSSEAAILGDPYLWEVYGKPS